jgi:hypothetical protein
MTPGRILVLCLFAGALFLSSATSVRANDYMQDETLPEEPPHNVCDGNLCGADPLSNHFDDLNPADYDDAVVGSFSMQVFKRILYGQQTGIGQSRHVELKGIWYDLNSRVLTIGGGFRGGYLGLSAGGGYFSVTVGYSYGPGSADYDTTVNEGGVGRLIWLALMKILGIG